MARDGRTSAQPGSGGLSEARDALLNAYAYHLRQAELYQENGIGDEADHGSLWHDRRREAIVRSLSDLCIYGEQTLQDLGEEFASIARTVSRSVHGE